MKKERGFTLIELLVVISIIGFLATAAVVSFSQTRVKARDARRKAEVMIIAKAVEMYHDKYGYYPLEHYYDNSLGCSTIAAPPSGARWSDGDCNPGTTMDAVLSEFITMPLDPVNASPYYYQYEAACFIVNSGHTCFNVRARLESGGMFGICGTVSSSTPWWYTCDNS